MAYFADDCVFYMPRGAGPRGDRYSGKEAVRAGLAKRFEGIPNVHYGEDHHWACGDFGVSEWTLTGTSVTGTRVEVRGVDLLEFAQGKITRKEVPAEAFMVKILNSEISDRLEGMARYRAEFSTTSG